MDLKDVTASNSELSSGFSTPPSTSVDTCDSGFTDLYTNNFLIISNKNMDDLPKKSKSDAQTVDVDVDVDVDETSTANTNERDTHYSTSEENNSRNDENFYDEDFEDRNNDHQADEDDTGNDIDDDNANDGNMINNSKETSEDQSSNENDQEIENTNDNDDDNQNQNDEEDEDDDEEEDDDEDDDDDDDNSSSSDMSELSDVFKLNSEIVPEMQRSLNWVHLQIASGVNPRECLSRIFLNSSQATIPDNMSDNDLWRVIAAILSDPRRRQRLQHIRTIESVCEIIKKSKNIIVLTGAGVSVSCGIPDFRSRNGIYERLRVEYPDMRDPQSMFDIAYFAQDPRPFYQFAKEIYPGLFEPSPSHRFIKLLERKGKLLRNYTQNIDTLERVAGIENVIECHGSFATASCTKCKFKVDAARIREDIIKQRIPFCHKCNPKTIYNDKSSEEMSLNYSELVITGIMKPDIVFFGESLPDEFHSAIETDKTKCDLLIVIGSSLKVRPVALIPSFIAPEIPQILINRETLDHFGFDVELLGDSDVIINQLCHMLGENWTDICWKPKLDLAKSLTPPSPSNKESVESTVANEETETNPNKDESSTKSPSSSSTSAATVPSHSTESAPGSSVNHLLNEDSNTSSNNRDIEREVKSIRKGYKCSQKSRPADSLAKYLPEDSFYYDSKNVYIFPGAEIWCNIDGTTDDSTGLSENEIWDKNDDFDTMDEDDEEVDNDEDDDGDDGDDGDDDDETDEVDNHVEENAERIRHRNASTAECKQQEDPSSPEAPRSDSNNFDVSEVTCNINMLPDFSKSGESSDTQLLLQNSSTICNSKAADVHSEIEVIVDRKRVVNATPSIALDDARKDYETAQKRCRFSVD